MNGVNINLFQFDGDVTWMAFFMDAQNRFYARYGGRDDAHAEEYLSKASLLKVMHEVLRLHQDQSVQTSRHEPAAKPIQMAEDIPPMKLMMARRHEGQGCIHCHDVKSTQLRHLDELGKFSRDMVFDYPVPAAIGIRVDRDQQNKIASIDPGSFAEKAGLRRDDILRSVDGQRLLTMADFARVLHLTPNDAELPIEFERDGHKHRANLLLAGNWRRTADPSWRGSLIVAGPHPGFWAEELSQSRKRSAGIPSDNLALRVMFLYPNHPTPDRSGLKLEDVVIEIAGKRAAMTIRQLHAYCLLNHAYGDKVPIVVHREGKEVPLMLHLPDDRLPLD